MAVRKALVMIGGQPQELPSGDTLAGASGSGANIWFGETAPSDPATYPLWFDTAVGEMLVYYNDGNTSQWVSANGTNTITHSYARSFLLMGA